MNILFVVKRHYSKQDLLESGFGRYGNLPVQLAANGHEVRLVAADQRGLKPEKTVIGGIPMTSFPLRQLLTHPSLAIDGDWRPDRIIAGGHLYMATIGRWMSKQTGVPWVYDLYDFYPAFAGRLAPLVTPWFHAQMRRANGISAASAATTAYAQRFNPRAATVRNAADSGIFFQQDRIAARRLLQLPGAATIVGFVGWHSPYVLLESSLEAVTALSRPDRPLLLAHMGAPSPKLSGRPQYRSLGNRAASDVSAFINACDVVLAPYANCRQVEFSNACKLSEYSACEAVVVASRNGDWNTYLDSDYIGLFDPESPGALSAALQRQLSTPQTTAPQPTCYWQAQAAALAELFQSC